MEFIVIIMRLHVKSGIGTLLLLSFTIGYCDTITFFTSGFFSAHVLGNIIFSAYQVLHSHAVKGFLQLLSFPVYVGFLIAGRQLLNIGSKGVDLVKIAGIMLIVTGLLSAVLTAADALNGQIIYLLLAYLIVAAMAILGGAKYHSTGAFSVVDTFVPLFWARSRNLTNREAWFVLTGFVTGCLSGAVAGDLVGLSGVMLPGVLLFLFTMND